MTETNLEEARMRFMPMLNSDLARVIILGALVGLATYGAALLLGMYVFHPVLCQDEAARCALAPHYGEVTATVLVAILGLLGLVRFRIFRPMIVVIAATISLWGLTDETGALPWYFAALANLVLYALAYGLFVWIVRIRVLWIALLVSVILIVLTRLVMTA